MVIGLSTPIRIVDPELAADRVLPGKKVFRHRFVHDGDAQSRLPYPAPQFRGPREWECPQLRNSPLQHNLPSRLDREERSIETGHENGIGRFSAGEQSIARIRHGAHSGCAREASDKLLRQQLHVFAAIARARRVEPGDDEMIASNSQNPASLIFAGCAPADRRQTAPTARAPLALRSVLCPR